MRHKRWDGWRNAGGSAAVWSMIPKDYTAYFNGMVWVIVAILRQAVQRLASCRSCLLVYMYILDNADWP
jgi:hypothetical protein